MALPYKITRQAGQDLRKALEYYQTQSRDLPARFLQDFITTRQQICQFPESGPLIVKNRRRIPFLGEFRYFIFYVVTGREIVIVAVLHQRRSPRVWKR